MEKLFRITYDIDESTYDSPTDDVDVFVEYALRGAVTIYSDDRSIRIQPCGLLRVSRSLIRLCTFPALYGVEANESVLDHSIDFRSVCEDGNIVLEVGRMGNERENIGVSLPVREMLKIVGDFHKNVLLEVFRRCPKILDENLLLLKIPDAFPLSFLVRAGKIALDVE